MPCTGDLESRRWKFLPLVGYLGSSMGSCVFFFQLRHGHFKLYPVRLIAWVLDNYGSEKLQHKTIDELKLISEFLLLEWQGPCQPCLRNQSNLRVRVRVRVRVSIRGYKARKSLHNLLNVFIWLSTTFGQSVTWILIKWINKLGFPKINMKLQVSASQAKKALLWLLPGRLLLSLHHDDNLDHNN